MDEIIQEVADLLRKCVKKLRIHSFHFEMIYVLGYELFLRVICDLSQVQ